MTMNIEQYENIRKVITTRVQSFFEQLEQEVVELEELYKQSFPNFTNDYKISLDFYTTLMIFGEVIVGTMSEGEEKDFVRSRTMEMLTKAHTEKVPALLKRMNCQYTQPWYGLHTIELHPYDTKMSMSDYAIVNFLEGLQNNRWVLEDYLQNDEPDDYHLLYKLYQEGTNLSMAKTVNILSPTNGEPTEEVLLARLETLIKNMDKDVQKTKAYLEEVETIKDVMNDVKREVLYELVEHPTLETKKKLVKFVLIND